MLTDVEFRELFHLLFLERFIKITDPKLFCLKGGVNLRFYFNSPRYSEDMDIDIFGGSVTTLKKNGYKILEDPSFSRVLNTYGITAVDIGDKSKAKHTDTVQRFKVNLVIVSGIKLPTKIEFSRRKTVINGQKFTTINPDFAKKYNRIAISCPHYNGETAFTQKIEALAFRKQTQARDLFDLEILYLSGFYNKEFIKKNLDIETIQKALFSLKSIQWEDFQGQVLEFLSPDYKEEYTRKTRWETQKKNIQELINECL